MALDSYAGLKAAIPAWLDREDADFIAQVPVFIALAEQMMNYGGELAGKDFSGLRTGDQETTATLTTNANGQVALPIDFLEARDADPSTAGYGDLGLRPPCAVVAYQWGGGVPVNYTIRGNVLRTYPAGPVILNYYAKIPPLSDATPMNWVLAKAPNAYLYGALLHTAPFETDDARAQTWAAYYAQAITGLTRTDIAARYATGRARVRSQTP